MPGVMLACHVTQPCRRIACRHSMHPGTATCLAPTQTYASLRSTYAWERDEQAAQHALRMLYKRTRDADVAYSDVVSKTGTISSSHQAAAHACEHCLRA